ncbi:tubulin polyglutamylase TTLL13 isoform X2 [Alligator mississippiensis]|uniref:tubulin polyglutamylase TTLL13 isoform X2 n=1 Tax=Alligator mississippiensis TaxID=8496 RepID=UPI0028775AB7|nr:tubulin polyglutamylase TTLL13 isoform X2 [Alligator mississippiensis]
MASKDSSVSANETDEDEDEEGAQSEESSRGSTAGCSGESKTALADSAPQQGALEPRDAGKLGWGRTALPASPLGPERRVAEHRVVGTELRKRKKRVRVLSINLTNCKYESVRRAARRCGLKEVGDDEEWTVYWTDCSVSLERVMEMRRFQKINHFPGMTEICRKDLLARNLSRMLKLFPKEYSIFPRTWCLPADYGDFQAYSRTRKNRTYICKPDSGCQGRGIFITRSPKDIQHGEHMICQQYIAKVPGLGRGWQPQGPAQDAAPSSSHRYSLLAYPLLRPACQSLPSDSSAGRGQPQLCAQTASAGPLPVDMLPEKCSASRCLAMLLPSAHTCLVSQPFLIDGFKFDMRIYVLVTSCDPLKIFVYKEGLARFATMRYIEPSSSNLDDICMHLTNYAINKHNENFVRDDTTGSKRKLSTLNTWMENNSYDTAGLWEDIEDIIIKTLISAHPVLKHNYRSCFPNHTTGCACFEILGFDILLDRKLKPWLLEVNHSPSFTTDSRLDREVKDAMLCDAITLINLRASCDKRKVLEEDKRRVKQRLLQAHAPPREARREQLESSQAAWLAQEEKYESSHLGGYRRIYPGRGMDKYEPFFKQSSSLFQETAASRAREECARQQLEGIRVKQEQREAVTKKGKDRKEQLQGETAGEKPRPAGRARALPTHIFHSAKGCGGKAPQVQLDSMQPQDIIAHEETERVRALLRREHLIRGLGIVDQLSQLLLSSEPGPLDILGPHVGVAESQPPFLSDTLRNHEPQSLMTLIPLSLLGRAGRYLGQLPAARVQLLASQGYTPSLPGPLPGAGQALPYRTLVRLQHYPPPQRSVGWLGGHVTRTAAGPEPHAPASMAKAGGQRFFSARDRARGQGPVVRRPLLAGAGYPGSLSCLPHARRAPRQTCSDYTFPSVTVPLYHEATRDLALTSASAPLVQRTDASRRSNATAVLSLPRRKWT